MKSRRLKLEFYDNDGVKHSVTIDGPVTREKIAKLLDIVEIMSGTPRLESIALSSSPHKFDRLASLVATQMRGLKFTASEARKRFQDAYGESVPLSTVSTYLTRLADKGVVDRSREGPFVRYNVRVEEERRFLPPAPVHSASSGQSP